jgi:hypothetical protein
MEADVAYIRHLMDFFFCNSQQPQLVNALQAVVGPWLL